MSEELLLKIKSCIEYNSDDKNELKKSIIKLIDNFYKVKKGPTEYNIFIKEQMTLLKENKDIAQKDKMRFIINLWNEKKAILQDKYYVRGYRMSLK